MEKISIIVPVFNMEKYIHKCLDSLIHQTYSNLEIIVIDDGSTDKSYEICMGYHLQDVRVMVYKKDNGGVADATNFGLNLVNGKYICFVDSDDFLDIRAIEKMYTEAQKSDADIIQCGVCLQDEAGGLITKESYSYKFFYNNEDILKNHLLGLEIGGNLAQKLFKVKLFDKVRMPVGRDLADLATVLMILQKVERYQIIPDMLYYAIKRSNSVSMSALNDKTYSDMNYYINLLENIGKECQTNLNSYYLNMTLRMIQTCYIRVMISNSITEKRKKRHYMRQLFNNIYKCWRKGIIPENSLIDRTKLRVFRYMPDLYVAIIIQQSKELKLYKKEV